MTETELTTVNGLVARAKHCEIELSRSRGKAKIETLIGELDGIRWELLSKHGVAIAAWSGKPGPDGKVVA